MRRPLVLLLCTACGTPSFDTVEMRIAMPLEASGIDYAEVSARQGGEVTRSIPDRAGTARLRLRAGVEATLTAAVFAIADNRWQSYEGSITLTPRAGVASIVLEVTPARARRGMLQAFFSDGASFYDYTGSLVVGVRDEATGFTQDAALVAPGPIEVPEGRAATFAIRRPDTAEVVRFALDASFEEGQRVALGAPPASPTAAALVTTLDTADLSVVQGVAPYALECAVGGSCAENLVWQACDSAFVLGPPKIENVFAVSVRYAEARSVCTVIDVARDLTAPQLALQLSPAFLRGVAEPVRLSVSSAERLVGLAAAGGPSVACAGFSETLAGSAYVYDCNLTLAQAGTYTLIVTATDLAGNAAQASATLPDLGAAAAGLAVVGIRTFPSPASILTAFLLGVDIVYLGPGPACATLDLTAFTHRTSGLPVPELNTTSLGPARRDLAVNEAATLWTQVHVGTSGLAAGEHDVRATVQWDDCGGGVMPAATGTHVVTLVYEPLRWLAGRLVMGLPNPVASTLSSLFGADLPLAGGTFPLNFGYAQSATPTGVLDLGLDNVAGFSTRALGEAQLTIEEPNPAFGSATVTVEVAPGPQKLVLQSSRVTRFSDSDDAFWPIDPLIGVPLRLLWESSRDEVVVVGKQGLMGDFGARTTPCGEPGASILDATLAAFGPGTPRVQPHVAMLVQDTKGFQHCELDLVNGTAVSQPMPAGCATYSQLVGDARSAYYVALGDEGTGFLCAVSYAVPAIFPVAPVTSNVSSIAAGASLDPLGGFLTFVSYSFPQVVAGLGVGPQLAQGPIYNLDPAGQFSPIHAYATAVDPLTRAVFVSASGAPGGGPYQALLFRFDHRYAPGPISDSGALEMGLVDFTRLALDAAARVVVAADNAHPPRVWTVPADFLSSLSSGGFAVRALLVDEPVVDLVIAGPQPVSVEPRHAAAGGIVTVVGSGFAGNDNDEVYVQGIRALTLASTPTAVTFRVPPAFAARRGPMRTAVTVRAHGRLSSPVSARLRVVPPAPVRLFAGARASAGACQNSPTCPPPFLVDARSGVFSFHPLGEPANRLAWGGPPEVFFGAAAQGVALLPGGGRVAGFVGGGSPTWLDFPLPAAARAAPAEGERRLTLPLPISPTAIGPLAVDPGGRLLALGVDNEVHLFAANALLPTPNGRLPAAAGPPRALAFSPDGKALASFHDPAIIVMHALPPPSTPLSGASPCVLASPRLVGAWPRHAPAAEILALYHNTGTGVLAVVALPAADGFQPTCRTQRDLGITQPLAATLSAQGDFILLTDAFGRAWALAPDDLRVLDRRDGISPVSEGAMVTSGDVFSGFPEAVIADPAVVEAIEMLPAFGWFESGL